jgi:hypothetical protein
LFVILVKFDVPSSVSDLKGECWFSTSLASWISPRRALW